jgi:ankyrin repeat protein
MQDSALAAFFIACGAELDAVDNAGRTPLDIAAFNLDGPVGRVLAASGADIHRRGPGGLSPAEKAVENAGEGNTGFLEALITDDSVNKADGRGYTMLHLAAEQGNRAAIQVLLSQGAGVNRRNREGKTALDLALVHTASREHFFAAEGLILAGGYSQAESFEYLAPAVRSSNFNIRLADGLAPLHFASRKGMSGMVEYLLAKSCDVNAKNAAGMTALHEAAQGGNLSIMEILVANKIDVNARDAKGNTVMHIIMPADKELAGLKLLFENGAKPNFRDDHGDTPLHIALTVNMNQEVILALLEGGADLGIRNIEGKTPLYTALEKNRSYAIPLFIEWGADIFAADNQGISPFHLALAQKNENLLAMITPGTVLANDSKGNTQLHIAVQYDAEPRIITMILDYHAQINARNQDGDTSLHIAIRRNAGENGRILLARGADIFAVNVQGQSPLYLGLSSGRTVREWVLSSQVIAAKDGLGNGALHYAAQWKLDQVIPELVREGAALESPNATGETPLFVAVKQDSPSTVMALLSSGAQINGRDALGNSALHAAVRWNAQKGAETLIYAGADINAHNHTGKTPLHDSVRLGMRNIEETLVMHGSRLEERDNEGNTPFMEAVIAGLPASVERLAGLGADPTARNSRGDTPLHIAVGINRSDVATMLLNWGAPIHAKNAAGATPFETALATSPQMTATLLTKDRISAADDSGYSPLHIAVQNEAHPEMIRAIIAQGARVSTIDGQGKTPLRAAIDREYWEAARILADAGSNIFSTAADGESPATAALKKGSEAVRVIFSGRAVGERDSAGNTILHYAARTGRADLIALLIELGASKNLKNMADESPVDIARRWNNAEAAALLSG